MMRTFVIPSLVSLSLATVALAAPPNPALRSKHGSSTQTQTEHTTTLSGTTTTTSTSSSSDTETTFSVGANIGFPIPMGNSTLVFKDGIGGEGHVWLNNILGQQGLALHASAGYQAFNIVNLPNFSLTQLTLLAGVEFMSPHGGFFMRPFVSGSLGTAYDKLNTAGSDVTQNANFSFVTQVRGGIAIQLIHAVSIDIAMPFTAYFSQNQLYLISGEAGLRVEL